MDEEEEASLALLLENTIPSMGTKENLPSSEEESFP